MALLRHVQAQMGPDHIVDFFLRVAFGRLASFGILHQHRVGRVWRPVVEYRTAQGRLMRARFQDGRVLEVETVLDGGRRRWDWRSALLDAEADLAALGPDWWRRPPARAAARLPVIAAAFCVVRAVAADPTRFPDGYAVRLRGMDGAVERAGDGE